MLFRSPGEVVRVIDRLTAEGAFVVADGAGALEEIVSIGSRSRHATARALVGAADAIVAVCDGSPHGIARILAWIVDARLLAPAAPLIAVVNRAPDTRFRRGEIYEELTATVPLAGVVFVPADSKVTDGAWNGAPVARGAFTRAVDVLAAEAMSAC